MFMESIVTDLSTGLGEGKYALAIHTASPELGLAMSNFSGAGRSHTWDLGRGMSTQLHVHLESFLRPQHWTDLAFIVVAKGPGGFTGTRIGVVTARTLAQQLNIPLFAISTLQSLGWATLRTESANPSSAADNTSPCLDIAVEMAARRGDVYGAIYAHRTADHAKPIRQKDSEIAPQSSLIPLQPTMTDTVLPREQWQQTLSSWPHPNRLIVAEGGLGWTTPDMLDLAYQCWCKGDRPCWSDALPYYGQSPV
ncbi:MAG: tRNA (adenosine(37)-N6)-threonylcarbamoyltransferase complex dimerization subunit type 1 TsaB [Cyanobacteria bacterium P01_A01_bin.37]